MSALRIGKGLENSYAYEVNKSATERWLEKMVAQGKLPQSALDALQQRTADSRLETTIIKSRPAAEIVPEYKKGRIPGERPCPWLMRQRWSCFWPNACFYIWRLWLASTTTCPGVVHRG